MNPFFGAQSTEGIFSVDGNGDTFYAGFFPCGEIEDVRGEVMRLSPAEVHPFEHFRPILGISAARAGVNRQQRVSPIVCAGEHRGEFTLSHLRGEGFDLAFEFGTQAFVFEMRQFQRIVQMLA